MFIGQRLREIRESKGLTQSDIKKRTGLLQCYTSRVEKGRTVPSVGTLKKYARGLEIPLHELFLDGERLTEKPALLAPEDNMALTGITGKERRELRLFADVLSRMSDRNRQLLLAIARRFASQSKSRKARA